MWCCERTEAVVVVPMKLVVCSFIGSPIDPNSTHRVSGSLIASCEFIIYHTATEPSQCGCVGVWVCWSVGVCLSVSMCVCVYVCVCMCESVFARVWR